MNFLRLVSLQASRFALPAVAAVGLITTGCASRVYAPPPPPAPFVSPLVQEADHRGMRAGYDDGLRDSANNVGYHPRADHKYAETPGYDPSLGPFPPYRNSFRDAYLRGYHDGFYRR